MATTTRARRGSTKAAKVEEPEDDEGGPGLREPTELHELMADYFNANYDAGVTPLQCAIFTSKRTEFRKSAEYEEYREALADERASKAEAKAERKAAREQAKDLDEATTTAKRRTRRTRATEDEEAAEAEEAKPAPRARRGRAKATEAAEETPAKPATRGRRRAAPAAEEAAPKAAPARRSRRRGTAAADTEEEVF